MQLVAPLTCGFPAAANGFAFVYQRGSATAVATCYSDFEGFTVLAQPSTGLQLDSNGAVEVYVNQVADVRVTDADGTTVATFTVGNSAPVEEVRSLSFNGTNYDSGAVAPGNPTTLQHIFDLVLTAFGTTDWNIKIGSTTKSPLIWLSSILGIFINVKDPTYGAVGDGVTDDTAHVQAALTAAGSPKGIVFFPSGTYRITSKLSVPVGVHIWGAGSEGTSIKVDHATADVLEYDGSADTGDQEIRGITIDALQANSGKFVSMTATLGPRRVLIVNCVFGSTTTPHTGNLVSAVGTGHSVKIRDCYLYPGSSTGINVSYAGSALYMDTVTMFLVAATWNASLVSAICPARFNSCLFIVSVQTSGTSSILALGDAAVLDAAVTNCRFTNGTSANCTAIALTGANNAASVFYESGNGYTEATPFVARISGYSSVTAAATLFIGDRDGRIETQSSNANIQLHGDLAGISLLTRTTNAAGQVITSNTAPCGAHWTIGVLNSSGGAFSTGNISFGAGFVATTPAIPSGANLANGKTMWYHFRSVVTGGVAAWAPIAPQQQLT